MNSSTYESRLWKRLVWFEAIFLKKNAPKLSEMCYLSSFGCQEERRASNTVLFTGENNDIANQSVDTSFFTSEKNRKTNQLRLLLREETIFISMLFGA